MNKGDLINAVNNTGNFANRGAAQAAVEDVLSCISQGLLDDGKVQLVGFGTFSVKERAARTGRNPRTGESIQIAASKNVGFKAGKALKESL
ncbi:MAG: HU family DNA-binding protein [Deltaproteobacteria bacterium]|nr:HU family DNA-binding protein [Deltaproteobacteria bacterium]